jgi:uncharacterized SAM-binding protein YcdF (DUF218 family)
MRWWRKRWAFVLSGTLLAGLGAYPVLTAGGWIFLQVNRPVSRPSAIVVLGGESWTRAQHAARVFATTPAPVVIVTGEGDEYEYRRILLRDGVPKSSIRLESKSTSTRENAMFTIPLLRELKATNVLLVTSWYHSRRTIDCFEHYAPDLKFYSSPTPRPKDWWPDEYDRTRLWQEYGKILYYGVRWGIW